MKMKCYDDCWNDLLCLLFFLGGGCLHNRTRVGYVNIISYVPLMAIIKSQKFNIRLLHELA